MSPITSKHLKTATRAAAIATLGLGLMACSTDGDAEATSTVAETANATAETVTKTQDVMAEDVVVTSGEKTPENTTTQVAASDTSNLDLKDMQAVDSSDGSTRCEIAAFGPADGPASTIDMRCLSKQAPAVDELPDCPPSNQTSPILTYRDGKGGLECTTQGFAGPHDTPKLVPGEAWVYTTDGVPDELTFTEGDNGVITVTSTNGPVGEIGPGVLTASAT
ncbi:hypothetical protein [Corynebacterium aquilae]|uniref:Uncharacterized protein n=1 Tax=Corynebacterium aquilae DSM 44791 TaxID=1431546 RepID=A0A1L7CF04_9CORY|nr:hypothetical protein [Corynebacterium aquilae]APT84460.1 hypothetical protein CAQU_04575 [Corynebacterium aquilae DSM 44791]